MSVKKSYAVEGPTLYPRRRGGSYSISRSADELNQERCAGSERRRQDPTALSHTRTGSDRRAVAAGGAQELVIGYLPQPSPSQRQVFRRGTGDRPSSDPHSHRPWISLRVVAGQQAGESEGSDEGSEVEGVGIAVRTQGT